MRADVKDYEKLVCLCEPTYDAKTGTLAWQERFWSDGCYKKERYVRLEDGTIKAAEDPFLELLSKQSDWEVKEYIPSPCGRFLAYVTAKEKEKEAVPESWKAPITAEGTSYRRESDGGWKIDREWKLMICKADGTEASVIYESTESLHLLCWSEDGKKIVFEDGKSGNCYHMADVFVSAKEKSAIICLSKEIRAILGDASACCITNDKLVLAAGLSNAEEIVGYDLAVLNADGSGACAVSWQGDIPDEVVPQVINGSPFSEIKQFICPTDKEDTVAVIGSKAGEIAVYLLTIKENEDSVEGNWKRLTDGTGSFSTIIKGEEGVLYAIRSDWNHPAQLVKISLTDGSISVIRDANEWIEPISFAKTTNFKCSTLDGAAELDGWILEPADRTEEKIPTVLLIHGGPLSAYADAFTMEAQLLAAAGMGVILVNPRGSSGYGKAYASYEMAFDGTAANDLLYYMDCALRAFPWMDEDRLGVAGGSYGGYMSAWLAGHCKRFKAAVVMRGLLSFEFLALTSQAAGNPHMYDEPVAFEDFLMKMTEDSPNFYAQEMDIPMLIMHGEKDVNTPLDGAHQLYVAVKDTHPDLPVRFIIFPGVGHNIRAARIDYYERYETELVNWLKKYL